MSERGRWAAGLTIAAALAVAIGLATADPVPADRVEALAARLRCPVCASESVADSPSESAADIRAEIARQVAAGRSDAEILDYFADRYTERLLLDPPARGRTILLYALPVLALGVGVLAIARLRRPHVEPIARSPRRALVGAGLAALAGGAVLVMATQAVVERPAGGFVTGNDPGGRDLSEVTNQEMEEVVAANPDLVGMRLALADRYFLAGEFSPAVDHYLEVLQRRPNEPEALSRVGWMAYLSSEPETAAGYLERALEAAPDYPEATWFLANVRLYGLDDPQGALPLLESLARLPDLSSEVREQVVAMLEEARTAAS